MLLLFFVCFSNCTKDDDMLDNTTQISASDLIEITNLTLVDTLPPDALNNSFLESDLYISFTIKNLNDNLLCNLYFEGYLYNENSEHITSSSSYIYEDFDPAYSTYNYTLMPEETKKFYISFWLSPEGTLSQASCFKINYNASLCVDSSNFEPYLGEIECL